ncbi:hypothetical protein NQ318_011571 [Aromia moschata]|uniref:Uncharacterized protein n=1 Tax=Aromia moschata TaxID=1265417 RepID=A0AAV8Z7T3_9CUCU|nr:hypothetical protein NQ318_011571 [Aromia moschata]
MGILAFRLDKDRYGSRGARGMECIALLGAIIVTRTCVLFSSSDDRPEILTWLLRIARLPTPIAAKLVTRNTCPSF